MATGLVVVAVWVCAGCATQPKAFPIHEVLPGVFTGKKPWGKAGFEALRAHGVHTILNLECMPWDIWPEDWQAGRRGLEHRSVPIIAAPFSPSEKSVKKALLVLKDPSLRPVYVHCFLGEDRSTFIIALYRVYFEGWAPQAAWEELLRSGFHERFTLRGLSDYFWHHSNTPAWAGKIREHKPS